MLSNILLKERSWHIGPVQITTAELVPSSLLEAHEYVNGQKTRKLMTLDDDRFIWYQSFAEHHNQIWRMNLHKHMSKTEFEHLLSIIMFCKNWCRHCPVETALRPPPRVSVPPPSSLKTLGFLGSCSPALTPSTGAISPFQDSKERGDPVTLGEIVF